MIQTRKHNDYVAQAALRGVTLESKKIKREIKELDKKSLEIMAIAQKKAIKRKFEDMRKARNGRSNNKDRGEVKRV